MRPRQWVSASSTSVEDARSLAGASVLQRAIAWLCRRYLTVDRRLLGAFRILLAMVLVVDVLRRVPYVTMFYSDLGVLPAALARAWPLAKHAVSPFLWLGSPRAAVIGMAALAGVYLALGLGYRTKLAQVLSIVGFASLDARNLLVENRGHMELSMALVWTAFLPLGDCYSVDAWRARKRDAPWPDRRVPVMSAAVLAITLQTAAIYLFNGLQKAGPEWDDGQAVHYVLWQNRAASEVAAWLRDGEPAWMSPLLTHTTRAVELAAALLVLTPFSQKSARVVFFATTLWLHAGIAALLNVWPHSFVIVCVNLLLLPGAAADRVETALTRRWPEPFLVLHRPPQGTDRVRSSWLAWSQQVVVAALLGAVLHRMARDNTVVPQAARPPPMAWLDPLFDVLRIHQDWSMFARVPKTDGRLVVDARTADGRRIDPLTGAPPDFEAPLHGPWHLSQLECDYHFRIQRPAMQHYLSGLVGYLGAWHALDGRAAEDRLVDFEVYWVESDVPPPGERTPSEPRRRMLARGP